MYQKTWSGDWHARVLERAQRLGYDTVTQYAADRVGVSLLDLAKELGSDDVAGIQVQCMLLEEAIRTNTVPRLLRDLLVRQLRHGIPEGWQYPPDDAARSLVVRTLGRWKLELMDHLDKNATSAATQDLLKAELPTGWLPASPDDPVIVAFVDRCRGRMPS